MPFPTLDDVVGNLREIAEDDTIDGDSKLASIDVDSLDVLEWVFEIEGQAGVEIDESLYEKEALETATVRDFYEQVKAAVSG
jgi:acyl carrier protein